MDTYQELENEPVRLVARPATGGRPGARAPARGAPRVTGWRWAATALAAVVTIAAAPAATAGGGGSVFDGMIAPQDLVARIDALEDVLLRLQFDKDRLAAPPEYADRLQWVTARLCGSIYLGINGLTLSPFDLEFSAQARADASASAGGSASAKSQGSISASVSLMRLFTDHSPVFWSCFNWAPWAVWNHLYDQDVSSVDKEVFVYPGGEPHALAVLRAGAVASTQRSLYSDVLGELSPAARTFLSTAYNVVYGPEGQEPPFLARAQASPLAMGFEQVMAGQRAVTGLFSNPSQLNLPGLTGDAFQVAQSLSSALSQFLPTSIPHPGTLIDAARNVGLDDIKPCTTRESSLWSGAAVPTVVRNLIDQGCGGWQVAQPPLLPASAILAADTALGKLEAVRSTLYDQSVTVEALRHQVNSANHVVEALVGKAVNDIRNPLKAFYDWARNRPWW